MDTILPLLEEAERCLLDRDLDRAAAVYRAALALDGGRSPLPAVGLARVALLLNRPAEAGQLLAHALERHPGSVEALTFRGAVEEARGELQAALATYQEAVRLGPRYGPAHANRGRALAQLGRWTEAAEALATARRLAPGLRLVPLLATALFRAGLHGQAIGELTAHLAAEPGDVDALVTLADALAERGQLALAREVVEHGLERQPRAAALHARRSSLALRLGDLDAARASAARQLDLRPGDVEALLYAASLDLMAVDLRAAEARVQQALRLQPDSWRAHYLLGTIFEALRLRPAALVAYRTAVAHGPAAWEPRNNLAALLLERPGGGAAAEARALLEQALAGGPPEAALPCRYNLALALWHLGDRPAARRSAAEVAAGPARVPVVADARRFLSSLGPPSPGADAAP